MATAIGVLILISIGIAIGLMLAALLDKSRKPEPDWDAIHDAYCQGALAGHLATIGGSFNRREIAKMGNEWLNGQMEEAGLLENCAQG